MKGKRLIDSIAEAVVIHDSLGLGKLEKMLPGGQMFCFGHRVVLSESNNMAITIKAICTTLDPSGSTREILITARIRANFLGFTVSVEGAEDGEATAITEEYTQCLSAVIE